MHCPRCGQKQISDEIKFCSKCGMPLHWVFEVLKNGGSLPELENLAGKSGCINRSNGLKAAALWFLIIEIFFVPITAILNAEAELVAFLAVFGFAGAVIIAVMSLLFLKKPQKAVNTTNNQGTSASGQMESGAQQEALPPSSAVPASDYVAPVESWKQPVSDELVKPGSVTEGTTRLLQKEEEDSEES